MQETWIQFLGREDPLEKGMVTHSNILTDNSVDRGACQATVHGVSKQLNMTEKVTHSLSG